MMTECFVTYFLPIKEKFMRNLTLEEKSFYWDYRDEKNIQDLDSKLSPFVFQIDLAK